MARRRPRVEDSGWVGGGILKTLDKLAGVHGVTVGIHNDPELALIAATNEFGTTRAGRNHDIVIPERSFMRSTVDAGKPAIADGLTDAVVAALGGSDLDRELMDVGGQLAGKIHATIIRMTSPRNAPATIARKGFDNPLVHTRKLANSITVEAANGPR